MSSLPQTLLTASKTADFDTIMRYADLTDDYNPLHVDREFAAASPMKGLIAHGTMSLNLIWQALARTLGADRLLGVVLDIRFVRPVREDDTVTGGGDLSADGAGYNVWVRNQDGEAVIQGVARIGVAVAPSA